MPDGPVFLTWRVHDAEVRFASAPPEHLVSRARKLVEAKFARGDYSDVLQALDDETRDGLARDLIERLTAPSSPAPGGAAVPPRTCP